MQHVYSLNYIVDSSSGDCYISGREPNRNADADVSSAKCMQLFLLQGSVHLLILHCIVDGYDVQVFLLSLVGSYVTTNTL